MKSLAIITVNYEQYEITRSLLDCFNNQKNQNFKIFVSDLSRHKQPISNPHIQILLGDNKGYSRGVNLGLQEALKQGFERFVVINNDTRVSHSFVDTVLNSLTKHPSSIIGGKIYYEKGFEYHKNRYKISDLGNVIWYAGGTIDWDHVAAHHTGVDLIDQGQFKMFGNTDFVTGCLMCFDKDVIERIGLWDESYFLYYEDADYCERAKRKNISLYFDPSIQIWHKNAQSTGGSGSLLHKTYQYRNRLTFGFKYAPLKTRFHLLKNWAFDFFTARNKR